MNSDSLNRVVDSIKSGVLARIDECVEMTVVQRVYLKSRFALATEERELLDEILEKLIDVVILDTVKRIDDAELV